MNYFKLNSKITNPSLHMLLVLGVAFLVILPAYYFDGLSAWKPSRAIGPLAQFKSKSIESPILSSTQDLTQAEALPKNRSRELGQQKLEDKELSQEPVKDLSQPTKPSNEVPVGAAAVAATKPTKNGIEGEENLKSYFLALKNSPEGRVATAVHYGDSTIAGDSIAKTIRARLQKKFGEGGPGFFVAGMDPRWMRRDDVRVTRTGDWDVNTILFGGNQGRYGLGGIVAKPRGVNNTITVTGVKAGSVIGQRLELYTKIPKKDEAIQFEINGSNTPVELKRKDYGTFTSWMVDSQEPVKSLKIKVTESGLEVYGVVAEKSHGATWETTAVVGVSSKSFDELNAAHLGEQTAHRRPDLIVLMIGGNEAGHGGIFSPGGKIYKDTFGNALRKVRQGSPKSACLVISPLDQGEQDDNGNVTSKKSIGRMVALQREVALEQGCAFWNSLRFMGGENSFPRWLSQGLAWTDLAHYTERGLLNIANGFTDALLDSYQRFETAQ
jgi:hypothetical protein